MTPLIEKSALYLAAHNMSRDKFAQVIGVCAIALQRSTVLTPN
jgi:hypothetical protein